MMAARVSVGLFVASIEEQGGIVKMPEPKFARMLSEAATRLGMDLFVFSPAQYEERSGQLSGFRFRNGSWMKETCQLPDILYDRCFYRNAEEKSRCRALRAVIKERQPAIPLNGNLPGKWEVYNALRQDYLLAPLLPQTIRLDRLDRIRQLFKDGSRDIFLKPSAGMQGKGAIHLKQCPLTKEWTAAGRTRSNTPFRHQFGDYATLASWAQRFLAVSSYIAQPYLPLTDTHGHPFDLRVLVQKNGNGRWTITGTAIRTGRSDSITSNLHGGGTATRATEYLVSKYGSAKAEQMMNKIHHASLHASEKLESFYGRLAELGIDFGIEQSGTVWLLEVNSRPGRSSFEQSGDRMAEQLSIEQPLKYARLLAQRIRKPLITNDSATGRIYSSRLDKKIRSDNVQEVHP
ncbi:YheC/YheD family protein [Paenibacillus glycanilyticus]|uniref:Endospore coat-associated protein YheD n=1 Tax=Paenibacillus glycanilyticus TaxID=126569 RepID=A0ABQ6GF60_9BACL|nr:YheC/YheD family protein [Paenibacillus glycanilyticus]GLX69604.1 endospore coat-associated protein YheD [Paenibacillus glycanilyticus]